MMVRYGFTTGSCAAAAAKAAAYMLLMGKLKTEITIETPKGMLYTARIEQISRSENEVSCAVKKDGGDDPDVTTGTYIYAKVSCYAHGQNLPCSIGDGKGRTIEIDGGIGVGRVTKPGLDQPVGNAAINRVPRQMIEQEVMEVCNMADYSGSLKVEIFVPDGERLARKTYNPRLGIEGGISVLGTSGIVEPMSNQAILDTIRLELNQRKAQGFDYVVVSPGNYGLEFMKKNYGYDLEKSVKCSNFIGATADMAVEAGFKKMLFTGHIGKLIKTAGGMMNTHSREGDCRMELLAAFSLKSGVENQKIMQILDCATMEEAVGILEDSGKLRQVMELAVNRICYYLGKRANGMLEMDCIIFSNEFGELARSRGVKEWFTLLEQERAHPI